MDMPTDVKNLMDDAAKTTAWELSAYLKTPDREKDVVDSALDLWSKLLSTGMVEEAVAPLHSLATSLAHVVAMRFAVKGIPAGELKRKAELMQLYSATVLDAQQKLKTCEGITETDTVTLWLKTAQDIIAPAEEGIAHFNLEFFEANLADLENACQDCITATNGGFEKDAWPNNTNGTNDAAWVTLQGLAAETVNKIDTGVLARKLQVMAKCIVEVDDAAALVQALGEASRLKLVQLKKTRIDLEVLLRQALLMWHLSSPLEVDVMRKRCQEEVKALRVLKLKEKEHLPHTLFKKVFVVSACMA